MRTIHGGGRVLAALLLCLASGSFGAEEGNSWTNLAGHALKGVPVAIHGQTVVFKQDSADKTMDYPLAVFPPGEQERLRVALQDTTVPVGLQSACEYAARILTRSRLLRDNGQTSEEEYRKTVEKTLSAVRQQAAPLVERQKLSPERLERILSELATAKD